jgi:hypothetical protein
MSCRIDLCPPYSINRTFSLEWDVTAEDSVVRGESYRWLMPASMEDIGRQLNADRQLPACFICSTGAK